MKHKKFSIVLIPIFALLFSSNAQTASSITGAWQLQNGTNEQVLQFQDNYFTHTVYDLKNKMFGLTRGGSYTLKNGKEITTTIEFNSKENEETGKSKTYTFSLNNGQMTIDINGKKETWKRLDDSKAPLSGVWRITARMQDGKLTPIHQTGARKTLKILTGTRFQWAAINPETKEFSGTGGGIYSFENGKYTENIEFFSRDNSRVGASLSFEDKIENGEWHHTGLSSKGEKIYEIWSRVK